MHLRFEPMSVTVCDGAPRYSLTVSEGRGMGASFYPYTSTLLLVRVSQKYEISSSILD